MDYNYNNKDDRMRAMLDSVTKPEVFVALTKPFLCEECKYFEGWKKVFLYHHKRCNRIMCIHFVIDHKKFPCSENHKPLTEDQQRNIGAVHVTEISEDPITE